MLKDRKSNYLQRAVIGLTCMLAIIFILVYFTSMYVSDNYAEFYDDPKLVDTAIDCTGMENNPGTSLAVYGDVEFFYNKWIVTDNYTGEPDGWIAIRTMWTGKVYNGVKLPKTGYASYRVKLKNVHEAFTLDSKLHRSELPYRIFINGKLITEYGLPTKEIDKGTINSKYRLNSSYAPPTMEDVYLVVEISGNSLGGLTDSFYINFIAADSASPFSSWIFDAPKIIFGILISVCAFVCIMCLSEYKQKRNMSPFLFLLSMILYYLSTKDGYPLIATMILPTPTVEFTFNIIAGFLLNASYLRYTCKGDFFQFKRYGTLPLYAIFGISCISQILLLGTLWQVIPITINMLTLVFIAFKQFVVRKKLDVYSIIQICFCAIVMMLQLFMSIDYLGLSVQGMETYPAIGIIIMAIIVNFTYLIAMRRNANMAISALSLEKENNTIKQESLKAQIKPHFIFNSLACIQRLYRDSFEVGDNALTQFSDHLRLNIDSSTKDTTSFEREALNILNYFELENMRHNYSLRLVFNVIYTDFEIPILSLQPIVENALKYSRINEKPDGAIEIYTEDLGDKILVRISDNGIGFDINNIGTNSYGLKNVSERLRLLINATTTIDSAIGKGTTVSIIIPKEKKS